MPKNSSHPQSNAPKPTTESVEIYPAGRGHILAIIKKKIPPKLKTFKHPQPRFCHFRTHNNPSDITITEYINSDGIKHIYLFPEAIQLDYETRLEMACALLATLPNYSIPSTSSRGKRNPYVTYTKRNNLFKQVVKDMAKYKLRRYQKWRKRTL